MGNIFKINQLFSAPEKCLKFGRQALGFSLDFSQSSIQTVDANSVNTTRPFDGIKGMFLQGTNGAYVQAAQQNFQSNTGLQQLLKSQMTGRYYWFDGQSIMPFGQSGQYAITGVPANTSLSASGGLDMYGDRMPGQMGPDGFLYMVVVDTTNPNDNIATVLKIDPDSGAVIKTLALNTTAPVVISGQFMTFAISSTGILAVGFSAVRISDGVNINNMFTVDLSTFTQSGIYEANAQTTQNAITAIFFDSIGNVLLLSWDLSTTTQYNIDRVRLGSLNGGNYTGTQTNITGSLAAGFQYYGPVANNSGGYILRNNGNKTFFLFDSADNFLRSNDFSAYNPPSFLVDAFQAAPEKGYANLYIQTFVYELNNPNNPPIGTQIQSIDSYSLNLTGETRVIPLLAGGEPTFDKMVLDLDNGNLFWPQNNQSVMFSNQTATSVSVSVNGTGQSFTFNLSPTFFAWIPLSCRVGDVLTFKAISGVVNGFLTNYDVEPFISQ